MSNFISLNKAITMTTIYRNEKENILAPAFRGQDILPVCETFDRDSFEALLAETDCKYIRVYLGMNEDFKVRVIAVGADSKNVDILPTGDGVALTGGSGANIVEEGMRCPTICPPPSGLNP
jgi:hypothetical protein